jgi:hypothetical protein|tara:strand:+ start:1885 stop:2112 length:228 start_codon:yes stop_codon:yes gene_type:complete
MNEAIRYLPGLSPVAGKEFCARFDGGRLSSDGGVLLFSAIGRRLGITVRGDGHYGTPEVMDLVEDQGCGTILGRP